MRLAAWLLEQPSFGDMRTITAKDSVRVGDVREAVKLANELCILRELVQSAVGKDDQGKALSAILLDALADRSLIDSLERVGGRLKFERVGETQQWEYYHHLSAVKDQVDTELRNVLAAIRRDSDNAAVLSEVLEDRMVSGG